VKKKLDFDSLSANIKRLLTAKCQLPVILQLSKLFFLEIQLARVFRESTVPPSTTKFLLLSLTISRLEESLGLFSNG